MAACTEKQTMNHHDEYADTPPLPAYQPSEMYSASSIPSATSSVVPLTRSNSTLEKPIVVPQTTNIFFIKSFSPFARAYPPVLATLPKPISQDEFLSFIDDLNSAFLSPPVFQAMHILGGTMLGIPGVLPVNAVGGVFFISSLLGSVSFSVVRVNKFLKKANRNIFKPRGLTVKLMSTRTMMKAVGCKDVDEKGKLKVTLPPLEDVSELDPYITNATQEASPNTVTATTGPKDDPRIIRLKVLQDYVSPLTFDVPPPTERMSLMNKYAGGPLRWVNRKSLAKLEKAREKSDKKREEMAPEVRRQMEMSQADINNIDQRISSVQSDIQRASTWQNKPADRNSALVPRHPVEPELMQELEHLERLRVAEEEKRDQAIKEIHQKGDKKLMKVYKKEEKIANRIFWVVITKDGATNETEDDLVHVDSHET